MRAANWDQSILDDHRTWLIGETARAAFDRMVLLAESLPRYQCAPGWHGEIRDFRYVDPASGERPFAFIVNRADLLFYVRKSGFVRVPGGFAGLKGHCPTAGENPSGEWTVRVATTHDADVLNAFLFGA